MTLHEKVVLSAYTGILMCSMDEVHKYIEKLLGRPVWTHELASEALWEQIKEKANPISSKSSNHRRACHGKEQTQSRTLPMRSQTLR